MEKIINNYSIVDVKILLDMMHNWFECKIRYEKVMEDGKNKKVTEPNEHIETYYMWKPIAYLGTFEKALKCYVEYKEKEMASNGDYSLADINNIRKEIYDIIDTSTKNKDKINKLIESI